MTSFQTFKPSLLILLVLLILGFTVEVSANHHPRGRSQYLRRLEKDEEMGNKEKKEKQEKKEKKDKKEDGSDEDSEKDSDKDGGMTATTLALGTASTAPSMVPSLLPSTVLSDATGRGGEGGDPIVPPDTPSNPFAGTRSCVGMKGTLEDEVGCETFADCAGVDDNGASSGITCCIWPVCQCRPAIPPGLFESSECTAN